ncbi:MAG: helix-turn-helix transcriptional regulator [Saprospiraceae bacterium]|nr:helix-turn-helix transcriptional regulator [Saprospiraceae bacterium]
MEIYFGKNINFLRNQRGMTQEALAQVFNLGDTTIGGWENGSSFPHFRILVAIREFFEVDLERIVFHDLLRETNGYVAERDVLYTRPDDEVSKLKAEIEAMKSAVMKLGLTTDKLQSMEMRMALAEKEIGILNSEIERLKK